MTSQRLRNLLVYVLIAAAIVVVGLAVLYRPPNYRFYVTCPHGVFEGEVEQRNYVNYSAETGRQLFLPDDCLWERLDD